MAVDIVCFQTAGFVAAARAAEFRVFLPRVVVRVGSVMFCSRKTARVELLLETV